jgi:ABC-type lipoprotein release transport system permease subunit
MTLFASVTTGIKNKIDNVISDGITGHIQVRADKSLEGDMAVQQKTGWDDLVHIRPETAETIRVAIASGFPGATQTHLVRQSVYLSSPAKREQSMLIGIDPTASRYRNAFLLKDGSYLDPQKTDEILLTQEQAKSFKKGIGERIRITTKNRFGKNTSAELVVAGIGDFILLSLFSFKAAFVNDATVQDLVGLERTMFTDLIVYLPDGNYADQGARSLSKQLTEAGVENVVTLDEKLKSSDLKTDSLPSADEYLKNNKVKISSHTEMGKFFKLTGEILFLFLNTLLIFLLVITSFLLTGIERFSEIGTLRAIGFKKIQVVSIFMAEILFITMVFALAGVLASLGIIVLTGSSGIPAPSAEMRYLMGERLRLEITAGQLGLIILLVLGFSSLSSFYPALKACSLDPAATIRKI